MKIDWIQRVIKRFLLKIISWHVLLSIVKVKKKRYKKIDWFRQKLCIPDHEIYESIEHKVKSKIGTIFLNEDILEEYSVKIYEIDLYFSENYKKNTSW